MPALWLALLAVYAATLGTGGEHAAGELGALRAATALAEGRGAAAAEEGVGFPLLILGPHAAGGPPAAELWLAALAALGFAAAAAIARRIVPDPYATGAALATGLSAPAVAGATQVRPGLVAGSALAGAVLLALRARESGRLPEAVWAGVLLALLPWLDVLYAVPALVAAGTLVVWLLAARRPVPALVAAEVVAGSALAQLTVNDRLYGALTPQPVRFDGARLPESLGGRTAETIGWALVAALAAAGAVALWRSRRSRIARAVPERRHAEAAAVLSLLVVAAVVATAATVADDPRSALLAALPCAAVPGAWALQRAPRTGGAIAALSVLIGLSVVLALRTGALEGWHPALGR